MLCSHLYNKGAHLSRTTGTCAQPPDTMDIQGQEVWELSQDKCYVALTNDSLDVKDVMDRVRSPAAGAIVVFSGMFEQIQRL